MRKKNNRKPVPGARGLLRLRCKCCGREFGTFLHIPQVSIGCHCGATISLEGLCAYEFDCECCGGTYLWPHQYDRCRSDDSLPLRQSDHDALGSLHAPV